MGHSAGDIKYRFQWTYPIVFAPANPTVLYAAAQVLFKSTDEGQTWQPISPTSPERQDQRGVVGRADHQGQHSVEYYGTIFTVAPSPKDSNEIWVGTDDGVVQITRDGGKNWQNVTPPASRPGRKCRRSKRRRTTAARRTSPPHATSSTTYTLHLRHE